MRQAPVWPLDSSHTEQLESSVCKSKVVFKSRERLYNPIATFKPTKWMAKENAVIWFTFAMAVPNQRTELFPKMNLHETKRHHASHIVRNKTPISNIFYWIPLPPTHNHSHWNSKHLRKPHETVKRWFEILANPPNRHQLTPFQFVFSH